MELFNGGNISLKDIPVLAEKEFREEVILRCREDARLMNFFGCAEDGGDVRLIVILGLSEESLLRVFATKIPAGSPRYQ